MKTSFLGILLPTGAVVLGSAIGLAFGMVQNAARVRNKNRGRSGDLSSGWALMPGSMRRVAFLMMALLLVQIACPFFFRDDSVQWMVSAGVLLGYGWTLFQQYRQRSAYRL
ncbi:MAG TPA: hypothetical protein VI758_09870 [Bacteroidota bacterium]